MVNIQEYLNNNYNKNAKEIKFNSNILQLSEKGTLVISDYPELEKIRATGSGVIKNITRVTISNCPQLKKANIIDLVDNEQLVIKKCPKLEILECGNNKLTKLDLTNCANLTELGCEQNQLTQLILPKLDNLEKLFCYGNNLTKLDFLNNCNSEKLERLSLESNNFPSQDLSIFSQFKELKELRIAGISKPSYFTGSCQPLQKLEKLEILSISGTDITHGLEYLPESMKNVYCSPLRPDVKVIDIYEELQLFGGDITKWREVKMEKKERLLLAPLMPSDLRNKSTNLNEAEKERLINKLDADKELSELFTKLSLQSQEQKPIQTNSDWDLTPDYNSLHFSHWKLTNPLLPSEAPLRLYQFQNDKVIESESLRQPYAILSYVWGDRDSKAMENSLIKRDQGAKTISNSASKAINKALQALAEINKKRKEQLKKENPEITEEELNKSSINYLWVDQLCMNQEDQHEKSLEVPKMGKYYDNSALTLIAMDDKAGSSEVLKVLKKVVNSEWFQRSWTFQEGWLSKWTVFMFDDILVDGRAMAGHWVLHQPSYVDTGKYLSRGEFNRGTKKIATPVGWVYYRHGYDSEKDKVELTLTQALQAIKYRQRTEPLDGIYSILGLLPYGKEAPVSYSVNNTPEKALREVMQVAIKNGYAEPLSWLGISNPKKGLCWMPQIDKNGSTSVMGSVGKVNSVYTYATGKTEEQISLISQGLDFSIKLPHYTIYKDNPQSIHKLESGFEIEGGLYRKEVIVKPRSMNEEIKLSLLGTQESLEQAKAGNILVVLYKEHYGTNKLLALLVKDNGGDIYHRLGLVELVDSEGIKFTKRVANFKKKTILGSEYQTQIEVPPKK